MHLKSQHWGSRSRRIRHSRSPGLHLRLTAGQRGPYMKPHLKKRRLKAGQMLGE